MTPFLNKTLKTPIYYNFLSTGLNKHMFDNSFYFLPGLTMSCLFCQQVDNDLKPLTIKGLSTIIQASKDRRDNRFVSLRLEDVQTFRIHQRCRSTYTDRRNIVRHCESSSVIALCDFTAVTPDNLSITSNSCVVTPHDCSTATTTAKNVPIGTAAVSQAAMSCLFCHQCDENLKPLTIKGLSTIIQASKDCEDNRFDSLRLEDVGYLEFTNDAAVHIPAEGKLHGSLNRLMIKI